MDLNKQPETIAEALALASQWNFKHAARIAQLEAELAEARKDGERYRYIRTEAMIDYCTGTKRHNRISWPTIYAAAPVDGGNYRDRFDAAIDAARGEK